MLKYNELLPSSTNSMQGTEKQSNKKKIISQRQETLTVCHC